MENWEKISDTINVVVLGKPCCGKSWTCNTLIGHQYFDIRPGPTVVTKNVQKHEFTLEDMKLRIIDTPPLFGDDDKVGYSRTQNNPTPNRDVIKEVLISLNVKVKFI